MNNFPAGLDKGQLFTSIDSNPIEKMIAVFLGQGFKTFDLSKLGIAIIGIAAYIVVFIWYRNQLKKEHSSASVDVESKRLLKN